MTSRIVFQPQTEGQGNKMHRFKRKYKFSLDHLDANMVTWLPTTTNKKGYHYICKIEEVIQIEGLKEIKFVN